MPGHYNDKTMMMMNKMLDPRSVVREGEMMQTMPPMQPMPLPPRDLPTKATPSMARAPMSDVEKVQMLMDMGLTQDEAIEAVVIEKSMPPVMPQEFGGARQAPPMGMGALGGVPMGGQAPMAMPTPRPRMPMDMGQDRTMNPMDRLTPTNVPST
jgi:hypothetical protein